MITEFQALVALNDGLLWPTLAAGLLLAVVGFCAGVLGGRQLWSRDQHQLTRLQEENLELQQQIDQLRSAGPDRSQEVVK